eukprot:GCRY01002211.1.p1 GENE.GCRY01002211.1~~GCRY01002211.1.p1  ORF type:complete len:325 (-),score=51.37 GCRY01002211.1:339-1313(-)
MTKQLFFIFVLAVCWGASVNGFVIGSNNCPSTSCLEVNDVSFSDLSETVGTLNSLFELHSCADLYRLNRYLKNGYYSFPSQENPEETESFFCDFENDGYQRVIDVDFAADDVACPEYLVKSRDTYGWDKQGCSFNNTAAVNGCVKLATFNVSPYYHEAISIRGAIELYVYGTPDAFNTVGQDLLGSYVDGISFRLDDSAGASHHVWTYAAGLALNHIAGCPCQYTGSRSPPAFVGSDYYCEIASNSEEYTRKFNGDDLLFDGENCSLEGACCDVPGLPWFTKSIASLGPAARSGSTVVISMCSNQQFNDENFAVTNVKLDVLFD